MPDLSALLEASDALVENHLLFNKRRCMPLRNAYSKCTLCADACPVQAISVSPKGMNIEKTLCINCGTCTTVCPVQALTPLTPTDNELAQEAVHAIEAAQGTACFACARVIAHRGPDKEKVIAVECLSRVEESLLLGIAAHGISSILLADGDCSTCKYKKCGQLAHNIAYETSELLYGMGNPLRIQCITGVPQKLHVNFTEEELSAERRSLFFHTKDVAAKTARSVATAGIKEATGIDLSKKAAAVAQEDPQRHDNMLNALAQLGEPQEMTVSSRRFASLRIKENSCSACQKCVLICPPKALTKSIIPREDAPGSYFEFDASKCVRCKLCLDVCRDGAIVLEDATMTEIFDFEPTLWPVPQQNTHNLVRNYFAQR